MESNIHPLAGTQPHITLEEIEAQMGPGIPIELPHDAAERALRMIDEADRELEARRPPEVRITFRWEREPLLLVQRAAAAAGVPYQTYMKLALFRQATADLAANAAAKDAR